MRAENIGVGLHYQAIHENPYYASSLRFRRGDFPIAEDISARTLSLPLDPSMSERDISDVVEALRDVLTYYKVPGPTRQRDH